MQFFSTRDHNRVVSASQAIAQGLSDEGGLFVPQSFPQVDVKAICALDYPEMAAAIVGQYLTDYSQEFLQEAAKATYGAAFGGKAGYLAPVSDEVYALELWHGPTCAFKDYALQLMPKLLVEAKKNLDRTEKTLILVATSGDTGKAALDGYHDIPGVEIAVFFPTGGTSEIQRLQMVTQEGENVAVYAVRGNFDDAQTGVKKVFGDPAIAAELAKRNIRLSSANSINWGRLVPQIVYYFAAYAQLLKAGKVHFGDKVDFCVPTGNFGDILAGYYAKQMGLPVGRLICASNENNVLTDFLTTGTYTEKTLILVATSGDTGKAALDGYHDIPGVEIAVFFPTGGTSEIQRLQMVTQEGENVAVYAVRGNFDDAQTGVKKVFGDPAIAAELAKRNIRLSSANSINWGRLVPQIVYYFAAYAQLLKAGKVHFGDKVDFCVPTGNFGDILAGYYAKQMGLPVGRLICASNENNVLTDFLTTGTYTAKREFFKTTSPSMDILVSSNLERLLYHVTGSDAEVAGLMKSLSETGSYTVRPETLAAIQESFGCGWSSEAEVAGEIRARYEQDGYLCDTHTAVAFHVAGCHKREGVPMVVLSTASPYKFPRSVLEALGRTAPQNDFEAMQELEAATGRTAPASLAALRQKAERFNTVIDPEQIAQVALSYQE